jgi:hypothetical protein
MRPKLVSVTDSPQSTTPYEPPTITVIGSVHELTQGCDKRMGSSDGFTFMGTNIVCVS